MDTTNKFLVAVQGKNIRILNPLPLRELITKDEALNLAAYLVALADDEGAFPSLLGEVLNT